MISAEFIADFESMFIPEPNSGCWLWLGGLSPRGYGNKRLPKSEGQRTRIASRVAYHIYKGPVPDGMFVCHTCDVRSCVNPDHLWLGTNSDNIRDARDKGRLRPAGKPVRPGTVYFDRTCEICGATFVAPRSRIALGRGRYCSIACRHSAQLLGWPSKAA